MAAEIRPDPLTNVSSLASALPDMISPDAKPELLNKVEGGSEEVHAAILIPDQDGIISISSDRSVRLWLLRDSGQYWPSVCHYMGAAATAIHYRHQSMQLFIGLDNGTVSEFIVSEDYNRMDHARDYHAHQSRVTGIHVTSEGWVCSVARDRYFQFHNCKNGQRLGGYSCSAWCTALSYDEGAKYAFIGDYSGSITVVQLSENGVKLINVLKGHSGSIQSLCWDQSQGWLYSGSYDSSVFIWDIGGRKGTVFELNGHRNKVNTVHYVPSVKKLMSTGEDSTLVVWDLNKNRVESADWAESDICQLCNKPFYWNFQAMYQQKQIGLRQHHCRKCGKAVCDSCSTKKCPLPGRGHEFPVRVCEDCYIKVTEDEKKSMARFYDMKHCVRYMSYDEGRKMMLTVGPDHIIKVWSLKGIV